jgi:hypothetical protein
MTLIFLSVANNPSPMNSPKHTARFTLDQG